MKRPTVWGIAAAVCCAAAAAALLIVVWTIEPAMLVTREIDLPLDGWPEALDGVSLLLISDPHFAAEEMERIRRLHAAAAAVKPDLILLLGDYNRMSRQPEAGMSDEELHAFFRGFSAPLGVYAVYGNHDLWHGRARLARIARNAGVEVLCGQWRKLRSRGGEFLLCGCDDWNTGDRRPLAPLPEKLPSILAVHDPDRMLTETHRFTLTVAGHLHGGQLRWPWGAPIRRSRFYTWFEPGFNRALHRNLYLTSGLGGDRIFARWNCPPEIVLLRLRAPGKAPEVPVYRPKVIRRIRNEEESR